MVLSTARLILLMMQELTERMIVEENRATWKADMDLFLDLITHGLEIRE